MADAGRSATGPGDRASEQEPGERFLPAVQPCGLRHTQVLVTLEGCTTCLNGRYSMCG
jgi:hypothetical protein